MAQRRSGRDSPQLRVSTPPLRRPEAQPGVVCSRGLNSERRHLPWAWMNRHRWTGCAVRLGDGQYSNCGYSFGGSWLTAARPAGTADRRRSGQPVAAIAAETGLSRHADNTDPSRAQYLRPYLVRAVRRAVSGASCRTRSAPSLTRGAPPPRRGSHRLRRQRCRTNHARPSRGVGTSVYRAMKSLA